jgi:LasA protease
MRRRSGWLALMVWGMGWLLLACVRYADRAPAWVPAGSDAFPLSAVQTPATPLPFQPPTRPPGAPIYTPTPDPPRVLPTLRVEEETYTVQSGDTLGQIAARYGLALDALITANQITNPDLLYPGQVLIIPAPTPAGSAPAFKIIPDSELVYGPATVGFDVSAWIAEKGGYLAAYQETLGEVTLSGDEIVREIARNFSVNPRLLLAVLEHQSGWVTRAQPDPAWLDYPLRYVDSRRKGLYRQLAWAANNLNRGYYLWRVNALGHFLLADGSIVPAANTINAGTAGVQYLFGLLYGRAEWEAAVGENGLFATYARLFGYPFDWAIEPLLPPDLTQPPLQLPFEPGVTWSFTGGPHGGYGDGSAWAALDFAPSDGRYGCRESDAWVTAAADGLVVRSEPAVVVLDLDGDGYEQTGWSLFYLHLATADRVAAGVRLKAGDRIGHPSCEGGVSSGTHVHLARRYNGEWISADGPLPFNLDGWISQGKGVEYEGTLVRDGVVLEASERRIPQNQIQR